MFFCILFSPSGCDNSGSAEMTTEQLQMQQTRPWMQMTTVSSFLVLLYYLSISICILYFSQGMRRQWISGDDGGATTEAADTYMDADDNSKQCLCVSLQQRTLFTISNPYSLDLHASLIQGYFINLCFFVFFFLLVDATTVDQRR